MNQFRNYIAQPSASTNFRDRRNSSPINRKKISINAPRARSKNRIDDETRIFFEEIRTTGCARWRIDYRGIRIQRASPLGNEIRPKFRNAPLSTPASSSPSFIPRPICLSPASVGVNSPGPRFRCYGHIWYTDRYMHHTAPRGRI